MVDYQGSAQGHSWSRCIERCIEFCTLSYILQLELYMGHTVCIVAHSCSLTCQTAQNIKVCDGAGNWLPEPACVCPSQWSPKTGLPDCTTRLSALCKSPTLVSHQYFWSLSSPNFVIVVCSFAQARQIELDLASKFHPSRARSWSEVSLWHRYYNSRLPKWSEPHSCYHRAACYSRAVVTPQ